MQISFIKSQKSYRQTKEKKEHQKMPKKWFKMAVGFFPETVAASWRNCKILIFVWYQVEQFSWSVSKERESSS